tara:strand:+ start:986 stop:1342 length:357 start_codon:yes stop_codon:yes gene_type:complete
MWHSYLLLGLAAGVISGFSGLGGGAVIIPALVYIFGFSQQQAQGTTLAMMVAPIGLLAAMKYYSQGYVKINASALMCAGFFIGALVGAQFVSKVPSLLLKKFFGCFLLLVSLKMILGK